MKILLVDDHTLFREGMKFLLDDLDESIELHEAADCDEALACADAQDFDLVLLDLKMPGVQGLDALQAFRKQHEDIPVVVLSGEGTPKQVREAIESGCMGYIPKTSTHQILMQALKLVLAGGVYLPPDVLGDRFTEGSAVQETVHPKASIEGLSQRQLQALRCVIEGKPNKVIASDLDVSEHTVKAHLSSIFRALGVHNRTEAVYKAAKLGIPLI